MVTSRQISAEEFRARRILANHKHESLAAALGCSTSTLSNFENRRVARMYSVDWSAVRRELRLDQVA